MSLVADSEDLSDPSRPPTLPNELALVLAMRTAYKRTLQLPS